MECSIHTLLLTVEFCDILQLRRTSNRSQAVSDDAPMNHETQVEISRKVNKRHGVSECSILAH